jgi:hypothetical protein
MKEKPTWIPLFALPNVDIRETIEVDCFALASTNDERLQYLARKHRSFGSYLKRFKTEFSTEVKPSILIVRSDAPERFRSVEAIASFRDAVAIACISRGCSVALRWGNNSGIRYSDYFYVYPWMVDKNYEGLISQTLDMLGWHEVKALRAQSLPGLSPRSMDMKDLDRPLLDAILTRWKVHFGRGEPDTKDVQLFRSLNMANAAARMPAGAEVTTYDIGRSVALWASAFEILAPSDSQAFKKVYSLLEKNIWNLSECKEKKYRPYGKDQTLRSLPVWIYGEINSARNDYLHGNSITRNRLIVAPAKRPLSLYSAPLYRMALAAFLDIKHEAKPKRSGMSDYDAIWESEFEFGRYQGDIEIALSTMMFTEEEYRQRRQGRIGDARRRSGRA